MKKLLIISSLFFFPVFAFAAGNVDVTEPTIASCGTQDVTIEWTISGLDEDADMRITFVDTIIFDEDASNGDFEHTINVTASDEENYNISVRLYSGDDRIDIEVITISVPECEAGEEPVIAESSGGGSRSGIERRNERLCNTLDVCTKDERDYYYWLRDVVRVLEEIVELYQENPEDEALPDLVDELEELLTEYNIYG